MNMNDIYAEEDMSYENISSIQKAPFHTVVINLKSGDNYKFLVFSREKFLSRIKDSIKN